jgi:hypothetical protein
VSTEPRAVGETASTRQRVLIGLVATLAVIAFVESYQGLYHAAAAGGRPMPWLWPCAVEGFTLAMNVAIWDARSGHRRAPWAWFLLILATAVSTALQVLDVLQGSVQASGHAGALGVLTAAWTPVALLLSFERWMWLAYGGNRQAASPAPAERTSGPAKAEVSRPAAPQPSSAGLRELSPPKTPARRRDRKATSKHGARTEEAVRFIETLRAGGGARPEGLHLRIRDEYGLERTYAQRLVNRHWPTDSTDSSPSSEEDSAA